MGSELEENGVSRIPVLHVVATVNTDREYSQERGYMFNHVFLLHLPFCLGKRKPRWEMRTSFTKERLVAITERKHDSFVAIAARDGKEYDMNIIRRRSRQIAKSIRTSTEEEEGGMLIEIITVCGEKGKVEVSSCNLEEGSCCEHSGAQLRCNSAPTSAPSSVACFPPVSCCL